jgi:pilus assembly protein FimV
MLIQVDWATGRLQREYTVLLDPPGYKPASDSSADVPVTLPSVGTSESNQLPNNYNANGNASLAKPSIKKPGKSKKPVAQAPAVLNQSPDNNVAQELTTKRGDTLSSIAKDLQVDGVNLDQMLAGLYEDNQEAFTNGNMNRLKVGQIIKVPTKERLAAVNSQEAKKTVKVHSANWNAYRNNLAGAVSAKPAMDEAEQKQSVTGKISTAEDKATPAKVGPQDVVKLSSGDKETKKTFDAKIVALQEETTAREKSLKEAQERTSALEKQIQDMQKLLALKNQSMSEMQKNAEASAKKVEETPQSTPESAAVAKVEADTTLEAPTADIKTEENTAVVAPVAKPEVKEVQKIEAAPKPLPATQTPVEEAQAESSFLDGLMSSADLAILGGATGVALLGAGWMFLRNKRRKDLDSFERGILTSGGLRANTVFGNTTGNASTSDTSFLTDFAQSADGSMIDTNDVDPIAEAEVYMAYGRDAQAEEILKDAISKEPKRYELHLKLLEMYSTRKDTSAFEAIAGELYTTLGADDPTWAKVAELGASMEPENPLYDLSKAASLTTQKLNVSDFSDVAVSTTTDLDFSLDDEAAGDEAKVEDANSVVMQSFAEAQNVEQELSFDLGVIDSPSEDSNVTALPEEASLSVSEPVQDFSADAGMDFDLGEFSTDATKEAVASFENTSSENASTESTGFDMNFNLPEINTDAAVEEKSEIVAAPAEDLSFDLDFTVESSVEPESNIADFEPSDISFDLPEIDEPAVSAADTTQQPAEFEANTFDLSSISLDLAETEHELSAVSSVPSSTDAIVESSDITSESPDVNIKLDLVAAYIDMDDKEGARELLEEVLKEGGTQQKLRAQQLIEGLA